MVVAGVLAEPYTGQAHRVQQVRGGQGADRPRRRAERRLADRRAELVGRRPGGDFANDPLELLAVDGQANQDKGDGDAATWLPPHKSFRCAYVSRQVAVKLRYHLWVTPAERDAIARVLQKCPGQALPR